MPEIRFEKESLGRIIRNRSALRVPLNQRYYSWKYSHVSDLFTDLNGAITAGADEYFLGTIIVVVPDKADFTEVYDGQQRIATTMILISAIRDFFSEQLKDTGEARVITEESLIKLARRGKETPLFLLSATDRDFFVARILREPSHPDRKAAVPDPKKESHQLIVEAAKVARRATRRLCFLSARAVLHQKAGVRSRAEADRPAQGARAGEGDRRHSAARQI